MIDPYQLAVLMMGTVSAILAYGDKPKRMPLWTTISALSLITYAVNWGLNWGAFLMALLLFIDGLKAIGLI